MNKENIFTPEELARYNRHIIIPGFGMEAQKKLKQAKVLIVGYSASPRLAWEHWALWISMWWMTATCNARYCLVWNQLASQKWKLQKKDCFR